MIFVACSNDACMFTARILVAEAGEADLLVGPSSDWFPDKYPCPVCGERCVISASIDAGRRFVDLSVREAFMAFAGAGLPSEQECSATAVRALLEGAQISKAHTRHISGSNRCCLDRIELQDGTIIHIGASALGASVYRVQRPEKYADKV